MYKFLCYTAVSGFGVGYFPFASGTAGSLATLPFAFAAAYYFGFWGIKRFLSLTPQEEIFSSKEDIPPEQLERQELNRRLLGALQRLDSRERDLVSLKFYGGFNNRQIARLTGYSESNVGTIISRAVHKLRTLLGGL